MIKITIWYFKDIIIPFGIYFKQKLPIVNKLIVWVFGKMLIKN